MRFFKLHWRLCSPPCKTSNAVWLQGVMQTTHAHRHRQPHAQSYFNLLTSMSSSWSALEAFLGSSCSCDLFGEGRGWHEHIEQLFAGVHQHECEKILADAEFLRFRMGANEWSRFEIWPTEWALLAPPAWNTTLALLSAFHLENTQLEIVCDYKTAPMVPPVLYP